MVLWVYISDLTGSRWNGILMVVRSRPSGCNKYCDLWPTFEPCSTWSSGGTALYWVGVMISQLYVPSLTPLSVAGCGPQQLGAATTTAHSVVV